MDFVAPSLSKDIIGRDTLTEKVYAVLKERILNGQLKQGERIGEASVSKELGVSATPVREALRLLNGDNLIVYEGRRGAHVISPTVAEIKQCYDIRLALETLALREAVANFSELDCSRLVQLAKRSNAVTSSADKFIKADHDFHAFIIEKANNSWLSNFHGAIIDFLLVVRLPTMRTERFAMAGEEHVEIAEAIKNGDIETGLAILERQIRRSCQWAIDSHVGSEPGSSPTGKKRSQS